MMSDHGVLMHIGKSYFTSILMIALVAVNSIYVRHKASYPGDFHTGNHGVGFDQIVLISRWWIMWKCEISM